MKNIRSFLNNSSPAFQILSDLHLEVGQQYATFEIPPSAPYLILAGDIGRLIDYELYLTFLVRQTRNFKRVFLVLGNHEFYGLSFTTGLTISQKLEHEPSLNGMLTLLHRKQFDVPNSAITILGCTLWSNIEENSKDVVRMRVNDFKKIESWTVDDHNAAHNLDATWLQDQVIKLDDLNEATGKDKRKVLVVTHHAPSVEGTARPDQVGNAVSSAFATDMLSHGNWANVKVWVFGHTHFTNDFQQAGIRIVSNQRGYVLPGSVIQRSKEKDKKKVYDVGRAIRF